MNTDAKNKLEEEKKNLMEELKRLGRVVDSTTGEWNAVPEDGDRRADPNDLADKFEDYEEKSALLPTLESRFSEVNAALDTIEKGTYGVCSVCGDKIEPARLEANPAASTCTKHMNGETA